MPARVFSAEFSKTPFYSHSSVTHLSIPKDTQTIAFHILLLHRTMLLFFFMKTNICLADYTAFQQLFSASVYAPRAAAEIASSFPFAASNRYFAMLPSVVEIFGDVMAVAEGYARAVKRWGGLRYTAPSGDAAKTSVRKQNPLSWLGFQYSSLRVKGWGSWMRETRVV